MRRIPLIAAALSLFISVPVFAQEWIEYENRVDFFTVNLPGQPKARDITYQTEYNLTLPGRVYSIEAGRNRYSVTVVDYTSLEKLEADRIKSCRAAGGEGDICNDHTRTEMRGAMIYATWNLLKGDTKVTHFVYTNADRVEGQELHLANPDGSRTLASIFMHENRLYILEGTVPKGSPPPVLFQQSMGFLDKDGKRLRYDTPYSNGFPAPRRVR
ncbi:MAG TPA: hypothetical protein VE422_50380 [Terriglobia bacterium]|nr:hypothetical protein [Terriglobia bacterium]